MNTFQTPETCVAEFSSQERFIFVKPSAAQIFCYVWLCIVVTLGIASIFVAQSLFTILPVSIISSLLYILAHASGKVNVIYTPFTLKCYSDRIEIVREQVYVTSRQIFKIQAILPYKDLESIDYDQITNQLAFKGLVDATRTKNNGMTDRIHQSGTFIMYVENPEFIKDLQSKLPAYLTFNYL